MRFKPNLQLSVIVVIAVYILQLGLADDLDIFIHPRYITFTMALAAIGLVIALVRARTSPTSKHQHSDSKRLLSFIPLVVVMLGMLIAPVRPLSSATVSQRSIDSVPSAGISVANQSLNSLFAGSTKNLELADWVRLLEVQQDAQYYVQKTVVVSGFVYDAELGSDTVWLARFVLSCCAVDAQPIGVPVRIEGWQESFEQDDWVEVEGEFRLDNTANGQQLVLQPERVNAIDQPEHPYAN